MASALPMACRSTPSALARISNERKSAREDCVSSLALYSRKRINSEFPKRTPGKVSPGERQGKVPRNDLRRKTRSLRASFRVMFATAPAGHLEDEDAAAF